jgi:hypothetical protein
MATVKSLYPGTVRFLITSARGRRLVTYSEVAAHVSTHCRVVPKVLWKIHRRCMDYGWPPLTAVVVRKGRRKPADEFLNELLPGQSEPSQEVGWKKSVEAVYGFAWDAVLPRLLPA